MSSIALDAIRNQHSQNAAKTSSPTPSIKQKLPTPPPPRDSTSAFSALGSGGPSDWEHFGGGDDEIDDEELFGLKKEEKNETTQSFSAELPGSQPSPPSTATEWPTPEAKSAQPAPLNFGVQRRQTFQPTPPPTTTIAQRPPSQPPQQSFAMGDVPPPIQASQPPPATQGFVMNDGGWAPPKESTHAQHQQQHPPPAQDGYVMSDGGWAAQPVQRQQTPTQARQTPAQQQPQHQPPPANSTYVMGDGGWGATQNAPVQVAGGFDAQALNERHLAEMKAKDVVIEHLKEQAAKERVDLERQNADIERQKVEAEQQRSNAVNENATLIAEIEKLKVDVENAKSHAASEQIVLNQQLTSLKSAAEEAKANEDAAIKEKDLTIERLKEDAEGRHEEIKERDATIEDLERQLEAEKKKEVPKPTPIDLIPDIDPWYAGSLERYIAMLRSEAGEPQVEDKIRVFTGFLREESHVRGLDYYNTPPAPPAQESVTPVKEEPIDLSRGASNASVKKRGVQVQVPEPNLTHEEPTQYSPGGRPLLQRKPTLPLSGDVPTQQSFNMFSGSDQPSTGSTQSTIYTPPSSTDEDINKTPVQSPPQEESQPQYKAYVPPTGSSSTTTDAPHRQSISVATPPTIAPLQTKPKGKHDEIFFGEPGHATTQPPSQHRTTSSESLSDVPVPAPLSFTPQPGATSTASRPSRNPLAVLSDLLPKRILLSQPNPRLQDIAKQLQAIPSDFSYVSELTTKWEKAAAMSRKKNDVARQKRQEESEAHTDELFNDNEISYADIGDIEDEFKEKERGLKAQEDRDEYKSYVTEVFDKVYDDIQSQIKAFMDMYMTVESLLHSSISGVHALEGSDAPTTREALELLVSLHTQIEARHEKVVSLVADRDRRYKKTEVQPLYAAGDIKKMKAVEKHFENAEKQAMARSKSEKAERVGDLVRIAEEVVVGAVGGEQETIENMITAIKALDNEAAEDKEDVLALAKETFTSLKQSSEDLLRVFNALEIELNTSVLEAEIAQTKTDSTDTTKIRELEREMSEGEKKLKEEFERRVGVMEQDAKDVDQLLKVKGLMDGYVRRGPTQEPPQEPAGARARAQTNANKEQPALSEEEEKKRRLAAALEEAKRRNGQL